MRTVGDAIVEGVHICQHPGCHKVVTTDDQGERCRTCHIRHCRSHLFIVEGVGIQCHWCMEAVAL